MGVYLPACRQNGSLFCYLFNLLIFVLFHFVLGVLSKLFRACFIPRFLWCFIFVFCLLFGAFLFSPAIFCLSSLLGFYVSMQRYFHLVLLQLFIVRSYTPTISIVELWLTYMQFILYSVYILRRDMISCRMPNIGLQFFVHKKIICFLSIEVYLLYRMVVSPDLTRWQSWKLFNNEILVIYAVYSTVKTAMENIIKLSIKSLDIFSLNCKDLRPLLGLTIMMTSGQE